jgi:hypothetical protein
MSNDGVRVLVERHSGGWKWTMTVRGQQLHSSRNEATLVRAAEAAENTLSQVNYSHARGQRTA